MIIWHEIIGLFMILAFIYIIFDMSNNNSDIRGDKSIIDVPMEAKYKEKIQELEDKIKEKDEQQKTEVVAVTPVIDNWASPYYGWYSGYPWYNYSWGGHRRGGGMHRGGHHRH